MTTTHIDFERVKESCERLLETVKEIRRRARGFRDPSVSTHGVPKIYALYDPREPLQVRYVGQTTQDLQARLSQHRSDSSKLYSTKDMWIQGLLKAGVHPEIKLLSVCKHFEMDEAECRWIKFWFNYCDLLNTKKYSYQVGN